MKRKKIRKVVYKGTRITKSILSEILNSFLYISCISASPMSAKIFSDFLEERYPKQAVAMQLGRLYKKGLILKIKSKKGIFIKFNKGLDEITGKIVDLKRKKYSRGWDKKWRIIIYDIPEKQKVKREVLRRFLRELGFGRVQDSCWVSFYDYSHQICSFAEKQKILSYICIYEGKFYAGKNIDSLVEEVWDLKGLFRSYQDFIKRCKEAIKFVETEEVGLDEYYRLYCANYTLFKSLLEKDPFLPKEFLKREIRPQGEKVFNKLGKLIAKELRIRM